jgi:hypothetical protein
MKMLATIFVVLLLVPAPAVVAQQVVRSTDAESARAEYRAELERHIPSLLRVRLKVDLLEQVTTQTWLGTEWENSTQTRYSYDGGNQTEILTLTWQEDDWVNLSRSTSTYNGDLLITQQSELWTGDAWEPSSRTIISYESGELTESISQSWVEGEWVNTFRTRATNNTGATFEQENDEWDGSEWVLVDRNTTVESDGDVVFTMEDWSGSDWVNSDRITYTDVTIEELFEMFAQFAEDFVGFGFSFRLPDYISQNWSGTDWLDDGRQTTEVDAQDRPIVITTEVLVEGEWVSSRQVRIYEDDRLASTELQSLVESDWVTSLIESYTYGDNGRVATVLNQLDFGTGLMNSSLITLEWTSTTVASEEESLPDGFVLEPVYPNPFNPTANVTYHLDAPAHVTVSVYDALGRHVATLADGVHAAGRHQVSFDATGRPSGLYIVRMEGPSQLQSRAVSLIR